MVLPALIAARISNQHTSKHAAGWLNWLQISGSLDVLSSLLLSGCGCSSRAMTPLVLSEMALPQVALGLAVAFEMQLPCFSILLELVFPCWLLLLVYSCCTLSSSDAAALQGYDSCCQLFLVWKGCHAFCFDLTILSSTLVFNRLYFLLHLGYNHFSRHRGRTLSHFQLHWEDICTLWCN